MSAKEGEQQINLQSSLKWFKSVHFNSWLLTIENSWPHATRQGKR